MNQRTMTIATAAVVVLILAAAIVIPRLGGGTASAQAVEIDYTGQPYVGSPDAPVKMMVFFDFLCPHCANFAETVSSVLRREYVADGRLVIYFANFPVIAPQGMSRTLAMVGECVNRQGRDGFGQLEPVLLRAQSTLTNAARAIDLAAEYVTGLDRGLLESCVQSGETAGLVDADVRMAQRLGVQGTPTVFVNGQLVANPTLANMRRAIEDALR
jgi:protein-disulfide isomerase